MDFKAAAAAVKWASVPEHSSAVADRFGFGKGFSIGIATAGIGPMMWGMSLEMLFKACLVADGKKPPQNHDLDQLAGLAGIAFDEKDTKLLKLLSHYIYWVGRYPVPNQEARMDEAASLSWEATMEPVPGASFKRYNGAFSWENMERIWGKVGEVLDAKGF